MKNVLIALVILVICVLMPTALSCAPKEEKEFEVYGTAEQTQMNMDPNPKTDSVNNTMTFAKNTSSWDIHGTLEGTAVSESVMVINLTNGTFTMEGDGTLTGKLNGKEGSIVTHWVGHGYFTDSSGTAGFASVDETITSSTGGLANLSGIFHEELKLFDKNKATGTYVGKFKFE